MSQIINQSIHTFRNVFKPPTVDCSMATASAKHTIGMAHIRKNTQINWNGSIQTLHTNFERSTAQWTFKSVSTGLMRHIKEPKNKEKNGFFVYFSFDSVAWLT